ncbi:hypothetical protein M434DRAFT_38508 [Hypoxylon sp. CO27-5]|nr:hypothetical protein M434DRAFT_38508 [Hypoxylon sp. CO27-5]
MTEITSAILGSDGITTTNTYTLPPQTTPFVPLLSSGDTRTDTTDMPESCSLSVYCRSLSYLVYSIATAGHNPHPLEGQHCLAVQPTPDWGQQVGYNKGCWPSNYFALFNNEWGDLNGAPRTRNEGSYSTAAFPGAQCLAGWTTACTTTITGDGGDGASKAEYPQAWCCPPGQWTCATSTGDGDKQAPQRLCQSYLTGTTSTNIWMYWDPPFDSFTPQGSSSGLFEAYTWTAGVSPETDTAHAATVFRKVFPLVLSSSRGMVVETTVTVTAKATAVDVGVGVEKEDEHRRHTPTPGVVTETEMETTTTPIQGRAESGPLLWLSEQELASKCLAAGLLGAAIAMTVVSVVGLFMLYRREKKHRKHCEVTAAIFEGLLEDTKYEERVLLR